MCLQVATCLLEVVLRHVSSFLGTFHCLLQELILAACQKLCHALQTFSAACLPKHREQSLLCVQSE